MEPNWNGVSRKERDELMRKVSQLDTVIGGWVEADIKFAKFLKSMMDNAEKIAKIISDTHADGDTPWRRRLDTIMREQQEEACAFGDELDSTIPKGEVRKLTGN